MGLIQSVMFGEMDIPDDKEKTVLELNRCRRGFFRHSSRYLQARIDYLEYALDRFRRDDDV